MSVLQLTSDKLKEAGISHIPVNALSKRPTIHSWKQYQEQIPNGEAATWFADQRANGIAIVAGTVSGNLEVLDFDKKGTKGETEKTIEFWLNRVLNIPELKEKLSKCFLQQTQSGGYHLVFRVECKVLGNQKLVLNAFTGEAIVETRGEGGYFISAPTPGYKKVSGSLAELPVLTEEEYELLHATIRSFSEHKEIQKALDTRRRRTATDWDVFNSERVDVAVSSMERLGWKVTHQNDNEIHFVRPGKRSGTSAAFKLWNNVWLMKVFTTSDTTFDTNKAYTPFQVFAICDFNGDFKSAAKSLYDRKIITKNIVDETTGEVKEVDEYPFFILTVARPDGSVAYEIDWGKLLPFLRDFGFRKLIVSDSVVPVRIEGKIVDRVQIHHIVDTIKEHIREELKDEGKLGFLMQNESKIFTHAKLTFLDTLTEKFLEDTDAESWLFFKNYAVFISKSNENIMAYSYEEEIPGLIWRSQIINRDVSLQLLSGDLKDYGGMFETFVKRICGADQSVWEVKPIGEELEKTKQRGEQRFLQMRSVIGYLLHGRKNPSQSKAVVFMDGKVPADETEANGGTGKSLVAKFVSQYRPSVTISGKNLNFTSQFFYQDVTIDTKIILIDDIRRGFPFDNLFAEVTGPLKVEKKNRDPFIIPFEQAPKFILTTNHTVKGAGTSYERRKYEVEFDNYYNDERTPISEFGVNFFYEWGEEEQAKADAFAIRCLATYIDKGLVDNTKILGSGRVRLAIDSTNREFHEFIIEQIESGEIKPKVVFERRALWEKYKEDVPEDADVKLPTFTKMLTKWCSALRLPAKHSGKNKERFTRIDGDLESIAKKYRSLAQ